MASSIGTLPALISLLFLFMSMAPSSADKYTKMKTICSRTFDSHWCMKLLKSDSRTKHAINNRNLTEVAIDLAYSKAKDMRRDFDSLSDGADGGSKLKDAYKSCSRNYRGAVGDLEQSKRFFYHRKYKRVEVKASDAAEKIRECKDQIEKRDGANSNLKKKNKEFELLCDIVKVVSRYSRDKSS